MYINNTNKRWLKIILCSIGFGAYGTGIVIPLITEILNEFPNASLFQQNMVLTGGASIFGLIAALLTGIFIKYVSKRKLLLLGTTLFFIGGVAGAFATGMGYLIVTQSLCGFAAGIMLTTVLALIPELFPDEKEQSGVFGLNYAFCSLFSMFTTMMAGILCTISWRLAFLTDIVAFIPIVLVWKFIPEIPVEHNATKEQAKEKPKEKLKWNRKPTIIAIIMYLVINAIAVTPYFMLDLYVSENGLGNSVLTGALTMAVNITALVFSVMFAAVYMRTKRFLPAIFSFLLAAILILLFATKSIFMVFLCLGAQGIMSSLCYLYYQMAIAQNTPCSSLGFFMGLYIVDQYIGPFIGPYLPSSVQAVFPNVTTLTGSYLYLGILMAIIGAGYLIFGMKNNNSKILCPPH